MAKDGIMYSLLDEVLRRYKSYFKTAIVQPIHKEAAGLVTTQEKWLAASSQVDAYMQNGRMVVKSNASSTLQVPVAGATTGVGSAYGGLTSGWTSFAPGATKQFTVKLLP
jgi:hypothetical protein